MNPNDEWLGEVADTWLRTERLPVMMDEMPDGCTSFMAKVANDWEEVDFEVIVYGTTYRTSRPMPKAKVRQHRRFMRRIRRWNIAWPPG